MLIWRVVFDLTDGVLCIRGLDVSLRDLRPSVGAFLDSSDFSSVSPLEEGLGGITGLDFTAASSLRGLDYGTLKLLNVRGEFLSGASAPLEDSIGVWSAGSSVEFWSPWLYLPRLDK